MWEIEGNMGTVSWFLIRACKCFIVGALCRCMVDGGGVGFLCWGVEGDEWQCEYYARRATYAKNEQIIIYKWGTNIILHSGLVGLS